MLPSALSYPGRAGGNRPSGSFNDWKGTGFVRPGTGVPTTADRRLHDAHGKGETARAMGIALAGLEVDIAVKEQKVELEGEVIEALRNRMFRVLLDNGHETLGYTAGKMRRYRIKVFLGDRVRIELSPYDLNRGRIVYRYK